MPTNTLYSSYKNSLHFSAFREIIKNPGNSLYILFFDVLFFVVLYYTNLLFNNINENLFGITPLLKYPQDITQGMIYSMILLVIAYFVLLLIIYSAFKNAVLVFLSGIVENKEINIAKGFVRFLFINLIIFVSIYLLFGLISSLFSGFIVREYLGIVTLIIGIPIILIVYLLLNIAHTLFAMGFGIKESIKHAFSGVMFKKCLFVLLSSVIFIAIYLGTFLPIMKAIVNSSISFNSYGGIAFAILTFITPIVYYAIHFHNRVYLYLIIGKNVLPQLKSGSS